MRYLILVLLILSSTIIYSCSTATKAINEVSESIKDITRVMPIQMTRMSQTDSYDQFFELKDVKINIDESIDKESKKNLVLDEVMKVMLGRNNWQYLKDLYGASGSIRTEFDKHVIYSKGYVNMQSYLNPSNHKTLIMEGFGRWFALRDKAAAKESHILLSGDVHVKPVEIDVTDLEKGKLNVISKLIVTRIPKHSSYYHSANLRFELIIKKLKEKVYQIDYSKKHKAYLLVGDKNASKLVINDEIRDKGIYFGYLEMNREGAAYKVIDLNEIDYVKIY